MPEESKATGWEFRILLFGAIVTLLGVVGAWAAAASRPFIDHATGSWIVIANDLVNGTLYRPLWSETLGFGGTRYFPLYPALLAAWKLAGLDYLSSSLLLNVVSCWFIAIGVRSILRHLDVEVRVATVLAVFSIGSIATLMTLTSFRGDLMPVAFAVWGTRFGLQAGEKRGLHLAALCFVLAFSAKVTSLFWAFGLLSYYAANGERKLSIRFGALVAAGCGLVLAAVTILSEGRFLQTMAASAGGGGDMLRMLKGPYYLERLARGVDPLCYLAAIAAVFLIASRPRQSWSSVPAHLFVAVSAMTVLIFGSPGTVQNHLIDLYVTAILVVGSGFRRLRTAVHLVPLLMAFYAIVFTLEFPREYLKNPAYSFRQKAIVSLRSQPGPLLSEDPSLSLAAGQQPYVADAFMLRVLRMSSAAIDRRLRDQLEQGYYKTVVLTHRNMQRDAWNDSDSFPWYDKIHFGPGFFGTLEAYYAPAGRIGNHWFYHPRSDARGNAKDR